MRRSELVGQKFGRWSVVRYHRSTDDGRAYWWCRCDCGTEREVYTQSLRRGLSTSCGCWRVEVATQNGRARKGSDGNRGATRKHGESCWHGQPKNKTVEYKTWVSMHERCRSPQSQKWENYGARGVKVCERWSKYENFIADMGRRPSDLHSLDRINNDGNYEPTNCRWATKKEQVDNRRKFGRIEKFSDEELARELSRRGVLGSWIVDGFLSLPA